MLERDHKVVHQATKNYDAENLDGSSCRAHSVLILAQTVPSHGRE
jgi:hypothetical protein